MFKRQSPDDIHHVDSPQTIYIILKLSAALFYSGIVPDAYLSDGVMPVLPISCSLLQRYSQYM